MIGELVEIVFKDHFWGSTDLVYARVWGIIHDIIDDKLILQTWETVNNDAENNQEYASIIKSAIIKIRKLKYKD